MKQCQSLPIKHLLSDYAAALLASCEVTWNADVLQHSSLRASVRRFSVSSDMSQSRHARKKLAFVAVTVSLIVYQDLLAH